MGKTDLSETLGTHPSSSILLDYFLDENANNGQKGKLSFFNLPAALQ